ncbi:adenylate/guanylate cyclase domain-containing protein [Candidatus Nitrosocosmicus franklandus]|uniref:Adenylate and Guanylate cyclase catalytic domain protein n=1 Tax=Candidatus Nitrosocosmicus franklandianus TaxID=1798806 RepID=A0A484I650_9ARCH|nr:adenylate/guanylate cyclase domain-containing protein [Candidatus Nitrosocosmicus franklandus]VFJ13199.1 Adenylate and Guanylate cyclase catalytic domain protein [Candidatus Nitrosocosmicus franklandus]
MNKKRLERDIQDGWYFFIDIVGSSNPNLSISSQLEKISIIRNLIASYLSTLGNTEIYKSFTGDGMLIVFLDYTSPLELSIFIHKKIREHNESALENEKIYVRIGIGYGSFLSFRDGVHKEFAPWGHELVLARRIMDIARPNQILLTDFAYQKIKNDYLFDRNMYGSSLHDKGKIMLKHHNELENVYSFYKMDEFGNNSDVEFSIDLKPIIQYQKFDETFITPIQEFCEARFATILEKFKDLTNPSKGLEIGLLSTGLIYQVLFENGDDYISATYLPPGEYWDLQNSAPLNLLSHQEKSLRKLDNTKLINNHYRFLIMEKEKLDADIKGNQNSSLLFIKWHSENNVNLFFISSSEIDSILIKYPKIVHNVGLGFWNGKYVLQFGPIMEYINRKDPNHPLLRRRFWLHAVGTETYNQSKNFFSELVDLALSKKLTKVDHNYYNSVINGQ